MIIKWLQIYYILQVHKPKIGANWALPLHSKKNGVFSCLDSSFSKSLEDAKITSFSETQLEYG